MSDKHSLKNEKERMQLELNLARLFNEINWAKSDGSWVDEAPLKQFLREWKALKKYFDANEEPEIGIIAIHAYLRSTENMRLFLQKDKVDKEYKSKVEQALHDIEYYMDEILREGSMAFNDFYSNSLE